METHIQKQVKLIKEHLEADKPLSIKITDAVCAFDFKSYAEKEEWPKKNEFKITFKDSDDVIVSLEDFIKYKMQYTDLALKIEEKFSDQLDELRDLQAEASKLIINEYENH